MNKENVLKKPWIVALIAILCCAGWGSAFPVIKIGYGVLNIGSDDVWSQILFAGIRFFLAGWLAWLFGCVLEKKILIPSKASYGNIIKLSLLQTVIQYFFFYVGVANTTGVSSSIITGTNPLWSILIAGLVFHQEKIDIRKIAGCILGFLGVIIANVGTSGMFSDMHIIGEGFVLIASVSYGFSAVYLKRYSKQENPVILSGGQFIIGGFILIVLGLIMGGRLESVSFTGILLILYLALLSALAYSLWGLLLKYNPMSKVAVYGFATPILGVFLSILLLNEGGQALSFQNIIALVCVSIGVLIVNVVKKGDV